MVQVVALLERSSRYYGAAHRHVGSDSQKIDIEGLALTNRCSIRINSWGAVGLSETEANRRNKVSRGGLSCPTVAAHGNRWRMGRIAFAVVVLIALGPGSRASAEPSDPTRASLYRGAALWHHAFADCEQRFPGGDPDDKFSGANLCAHWIGDNDMTFFDACERETPAECLVNWPQAKSSQPFLHLSPSRRT
jgi:hypothetical protein